MKRIICCLLVLLTITGISQEVIQLPPAEESIEETTERMLDFSLIVNSRVYRFDTVLEEDLPYFSLTSIFRALGPIGASIIQMDRRKVVIQISEEEIYDLDIASGVIKQQDGERVLSADVMLVEDRPYVRFNFMNKVLPELIGKEVSFDAGTNTFFLGTRNEARLDFDVKVTDPYAVFSLLFPARVRYRIDQLDDQLTITINSRFQAPESDLTLEENPFFRVNDFRTEPGRTIINMELSDRVHTVSDSFEKNFNRLRVYFYSPEYYTPESDVVNRALPIYRPSVETVQKIIIDPGHGGEDEGAIGAKGVIEKDIVLAISYRLADELKQRGYDVVLTRYSDVYVPLADRTGIANTNNGDIFVSIHVNASVRRASGAETYYLSLKGAETVSDTVAFENRELREPDTETESNPEEGNDLLFILWEMAQTEYLKDSARLAEQMQRAMNDMTGIRDRGVKQANLVVLRGLNMPGVLVEVAFISNPSEEARLTQPSFHGRVAQALADSIDRYRVEVENRMRPILEEPEPEGFLP